MIRRRPYRPELCTQSQIEQFWKHVCHPLGWAGRGLWFVIVAPDGRPSPRIHEVRDASGPVDPDLVDRLVRNWAAAFEGEDPRWAIAAMLCRPGDAALTVDDCHWAEALIRSSRAAVVGLLPLHLATDTAIRPIPLDELGAICR